MSTHGKILYELDLFELEFKLERYNLQSRED